VDWNRYQTTIFEDVADDLRGSLVVIARAGTGKTSTAIEALTYCDPRDKILMVAFNAAIKRELQQRAPDYVRVSTLHGHGFGAIQRAYGGKVEVEEQKSRRRLNEQYDAVAWELRTAACKAASFAKGSMVASDDQASIERILDSKWISFESEADRTATVGMVSWLLEDAKEPNGTIDFDDMPWLPIMNNLSCFRNDWVFVDEAQDLNRCQLELVRRSLKRGGRMCAFGDPKQAIYYFRGADRSSIARLERYFNARRLPLSITYRCPSEVVKHVQDLVPDFEAAPGCPEGLVAEKGWSAMLAGAEPGDFILSRVNAPLIGLCLGFIKEGRRATILGRNIGRGLERLIQQSNADSADKLSGWARTWCAREIMRVRKVDPEADITQFRDRRDCVEALCEGSSTIDEVVDKVRDLFSDNGADARGHITLSSTHKAKGLERNTVWMLADTYRKNGSDEEQNLYYVAATRAQLELFLVHGSGQ
jgi:superfamily I DNA/RNA helicase